MKFTVPLMSRRAIDRVIAESLPRRNEVLEPHDREHYWRSRGEHAIRAEMERSVSRRQGHV